MPHYIASYWLHDLSPIIVKLGPLTLRWYGVFFISGFIFAYFIFKKLIRQKLFRFPVEQVDNLLLYLLVSVVIGARLLYVLVYSESYNVYFQYPWKVFAVWEGGLSFHGGLLGIVFLGLWISKKIKISYLHFADIVSLVSPLGLGFGRLGNFMNGELYGREAHIPWAIIFPQGGNIPRHPSQLYESLFEGFLLFIILWLCRKRLHNQGFIFTLFLFLYGTFRFTIEFFRQPDSQMGFYFGFLSMGQILCLFMIASAVALTYRLSSKPA
ncbi:MAG: prolipoprotein diacylglyceryl transferase [Deltaproteobacteria bacterium]|nr:prolipoprotein diacylglyceryl transferase [Deltaproteobacteria bacterium]